MQPLIADSIDEDRTEDRSSTRELRIGEANRKKGTELEEGSSVEDESVVHRFSISFFDFLYSTTQRRKRNSTLGSIERFNCNWFNCLYFQI